MGLFDRFRRRPAFEPWPRSRFEPGGNEAQFEFYCFGYEDTQREPPFDLGAEGYRGAELPEGVGIRTDIADGAAADDFFGFYRESLAEAFPSLDAARVRVAHLIVGNVPDPADLTYLQAAWAAVRWQLRNGALVVRDVRAERWRTREDVLAADPRDPTMACGWRVIVEHEETPGYGHLVYTLGMAKFGRPDVLTAVPAAHVDEAAQLLNTIATGLIEGKRMHELPHRASEGYTFEAYGAGLNAPPRDIFNDEVVLLRLG